jgi:hypothetical protein
MTRLSFTQTTQNAVRELDRLEGVKNRLAGLIVDLHGTNNPAAQTWIREYTLRLKENVIPAIEEVKAYLISQDALVTKISN